MPKEFDVFIVGGGPAGQTLANACHAGGLRVGITENRGYSGTCGLRGCDPKRVMGTAVEAVDHVDRLRGHGVNGRVDLDWTEMHAFVDSFIDGKPARARRALEEEGITTFTDTACFTGPKALKVGEHTVEAKHIVLATGQHPAPLDIPGDEHALTSDDFHRLDQLPERVLFVGGGYIGLESAHIAARAGREVTILNNDDDPLPMFETDLANSLLKVTTDELGIKLVLNCRAKAIERIGTGFRVSAEDADGRKQHFEVDLVFNTAGRTATFESLDLESAGIEASPKGIPVDEYLRVKDRPNVYAIGDIADSDGPPLTPVAELDAKALAKTLVDGELTRPDYSGLSTAVYTLPELAMVGLTEKEARDRGYEVEVKADLDATHIYNARRTKARACAYKTIVDAKTGKLLGAHLLGPHASEAINIFALAIRAGLQASLLRDTPWAYPTWGSDVSRMV